VLLRLAYLTVTNTFDVLRLFPIRDRDKDIEILALRHQLGVLERQLGNEKMRFTPADTLGAYSAELTGDGYAYRFRHDDRPLGRAEGAFLLCGFFVALATRQQGDLPAALRWFERNRAACGSAGLLAEEYDVAQRQMRGNLPQAFVHALLLECAAHLNMAVAMSWQEPCESRAPLHLRSA
jgi:hypothetical protein